MLFVSRRSHNSYSSDNCHRQTLTKAQSTPLDNNRQFHRQDTVVSYTSDPV